MSKVLGAAEEQLPLFWGVKDCFVSSNTNCFVSFHFVNYQLFRFVSSITNCFISFRFVEYHKPEILYSIYQRIYIFMIVFLRKH